MLRRRDWRSTRLARLTATAAISRVSEGRSRQGGTGVRATGRRERTRSTPRRHRHRRGGLRRRPRRGGDDGNGPASRREGVRHTRLSHLTHDVRGMCFQLANAHGSRRPVRRLLHVVPHATTLCQRPWDVKATHRCHPYRSGRKNCDDDSSGHQDARIDGWEVLAELRENMTGPT